MGHVIMYSDLFNNLIQTFQHIRFDFGKLSDLATWQAELGIIRIVCCLNTMNRQIIPINTYDTSKQ